ncbi:MAG: hypothetical protein ACK41C_01080 [Phenylobacterium sp.]|uniref:hypothetical protein n=1 Tax=Phenylobacterium sp. TaxID=1871053 RepID=UPI0039189B89
MHHYRLAVAVALVAVFFTGATSQSAAQTSDRQRVVAIAEKLQAAPLDPALSDEREWAVAWLLTLIIGAMFAITVAGFLSALLAVRQHRS